MDEMTMEAPHVPTVPSCLAGTTCCTLGLYCFSGSCSFFHPSSCSQLYHAGPVRRGQRLWLHHHEMESQSLFSHPSVIYQHPQDVRHCPHSSSARDSYPLYLSGQDLCLLYPCSTTLASDSKVSSSTMLPPLPFLQLGLIPSSP